MTIHDVITNLDNTIAGKKELLAAMNKEASTWNLGMGSIVHMNIAELERIRADLIKVRDNA